MENNKKGISFIKLICILIIVVVIYSVIYVYASKVTNHSIGQNNGKMLGTEEESDLLIQEKVYEEYEDYDEEDYGNKIDTTKPYVYTIEEKYDSAEYEDATDNILNNFRVNIDTDEINSLNKRIEDFYNQHKDAYTNTPEDVSQLPEINYVYCVTDGVLSLEIYYCDETMEYNRSIYNIDIKEKKFLNNRELLEKFEISKESFEKAVRDNLFDIYISYTSNWDEFNEKYDSFEKYLADIHLAGNSSNKSISYENICDCCEIMLVSNDNDQLYVSNMQIPTPWGDYSEGFYFYITPIYVFNRSYSFNYGDFKTYNEYNRGYASNNVPIINLDSGDADKVNKELEDFFDKAKELINKNGGEVLNKAIETDVKMELADGEFENALDEIIVNKDGEKVIDEYFTIDYKYSIINEKVLAILVEKTNSKYCDLDHGMWDYYTYNFDLETGKLLSNKEFIEKCGYSVDAFKEKFATNGDIELLNITFMDRGDFYNNYGHQIDGEGFNTFYVFREKDAFDWKKVTMPSENTEI